MRIMIVDDHELFRNGLRYQLAHIDPSMEIVEADTFHDAIHLAGSAPRLDKVFLDVMIPDMDWREALLALRDRPEPPDVVVVSGVGDARIIRAAIDHGACGFIPKSLKGDILESALRLVLVGGFSIAPQGVTPAVGGLTLAAGGLGGGAVGVAEDVPLTPRQREVLNHIHAGLSNRQIAQAMTLSEATIKMHIGRLFKVLGAQSRTDALAVARRKGVL
ncbi:LuxR C-terminal-related transcriptional regulator [Pararhodospirillum oryzae]|nr:response regulator transcription factor [Pararhodospirillum oryzae]